MRKGFLATGLSQPGPALWGCPAAAEWLPLACPRLQSVGGSRWRQGLRSECQSPLLKQLLQSLFQLPVRPLKALHHLRCPLKVFLDSLIRPPCTCMDRKLLTGRLGRHRGGLAAGPGDDLPVVVTGPRNVPGAQL